MADSSVITIFPSQKRSQAEKNEKWAIDCVDAAEHLVIFRDQRIRQSQYNKKVNYNLANDILDIKDIEGIINPLGLKGATFPAKMQNYPLINPKIDLLVGEESKRRFDWKIRAINEDAVSEKQNEKKQALLSLAVEVIKSESFDETSLKRRLNDLNKYYNYDYLELREQMATKILKYLYRSMFLKMLFNRGFHDALIAGEEIYCADVVSGEPVLRKVNPLNLYTIRSGDSPYIEDSDVIIEEIYKSPGQVVDEYYEELTEEEIVSIEEGHVNNAVGTGVLSYKALNPNISIDDFVQQNSRGLIVVNEKGVRAFGGAYDSEGNIRIIRVVWKSRKKIGKLSWIDENGEKQEDIIDENYKPSKERGETVEWLWVNEYWEGTKIGENIYVKLRPRPVQFRSMINLSSCKPGYVGTLYNINDSKVKSLMDRGKPYQYLYNIFMYRTELAFAKSKGKIAELDISKVPDGWTMDKWMYYAEIMGWAVVDPFNEGKKGQALGKLSGTFNTTGKVLDMELGNYIQQHISMLQYIENQMGQIVGVTNQRQGQIETRELVGNVERAVSQSSHITEKWFMLHDNTKVRAMEALLETAKFAWRGKTKKLQYVLDDLSTEILDVDGNMFNESEYSLFVSDGTSDAELISALKGLAQAGLQNDKISFSSLMSIYNSDSVASIRRKIEASEQEAIDRNAETEKNRNESMMQAEQMKAEDKQKDRDLEKYKVDSTNETKIHVQELANYFQNTGEDLDSNGVPDAMEIAQHSLEQQRLSSDIFMKQQELQHEREKNTKESNLKAKELEAKIAVENKKLEQIKEQNKNQISLANKKAANDEKMMKGKMALEKMKVHAAVQKMKKSTKVK